MVPPIPLLDPYVSCTSFSVASAAVFSGPCSRPRDIGRRSRTRFWFSRKAEVHALPPRGLESHGPSHSAARSDLPLKPPHLGRELERLEAVRDVVAAAGDVEERSVPDRRVVAAGREKDHHVPAEPTLLKPVKVRLSTIGVPPMWAQPSSGRLNGYQGAYSRSPAASSGPG